MDGTGEELKQSTCVCSEEDEDLLYKGCRIESGSRGEPRLALWSRGPLGLQVYD